jgi:hypothetical protein
MLDQFPLFLKPIHSHRPILPRPPGGHGRGSSGPLALAGLHARGKAVVKRWGVCRRWQRWSLNLPGVPQMNELFKIPQPRTE